MIVLDSRRNLWLVLEEYFIHLNDENACLSSNFYHILHCISLLSLLIILELNLNSKIWKID